MTTADPRTVIAGFIESQRELMAYGPDEGVAFAAYAAQAAQEYSARTYPWGDDE